MILEASDARTGHVLHSLEAQLSALHNFKGNDCAQDRGCIRQCSCSSLTRPESSAVRKVWYEPSYCRKYIQALHFMPLLLGTLCQSPQGSHCQKSRLNCPTGLSVRQAYCQQHCLTDSLQIVFMEQDLLTSPLLLQQLQLLLCKMTRMSNCRDVLQATPCHACQHQHLRLRMGPGGPSALLLVW